MERCLLANDRDGAVAQLVDFISDGIKELGST
jgi:hypothetical protein